MLGSTKRRWVATIAKIVMAEKSFWKKHGDTMVIIGTLITAFGGGLGGATLYLSHRIGQNNEAVLRAYDTIVDMQGQMSNNQAVIHEFKNAHIREHDLRYGGQEGTKASIEAKSKTP